MSSLAFSPTMSRSFLTGQPMRLRLGKKLHEGGEAEIFAIESHPDLLAKIYKYANPMRSRKLRAMLAAPPNQDQHRPLVAWPVDGLVDRKESEPKGVIVPYAKNTLTLLDVFTPKRRAKLCPDVDSAFLARVASNLCAAVHLIHKGGHVIGDLNELNTMVRRDATVILVDADSFQVSDHGEILPCTVGRPEYTPPELQASSLARIARTRASDYFGLAVLVYKILMDGRHPFCAFDPDAETAVEAIKRGRFPHASPAPTGVIVPSRYRLTRLPGLLVPLFRQAFIDGHVEPYSRPNALTWERTLRQSEPYLAGLHHV